MIKNYELFESKIGYDSQNKGYLIRVYDLLVEEMNHNPAPTWTGIMVKMLCSYDTTKRSMVKGPNWDRFVSSEDWSWFIMKTGSCERSKVVK